MHAKPRAKRAGLVAPHGEHLLGVLASQACHDRKRGGERALRPIGRRGRIVLGCRGAGHGRGGLPHASGNFRRHHQPRCFPGGKLVTQAVDHAARQLDFQQVRLLALNECGGAQQQRTALADAPRYKNAPRFALRAFDHQVRPAEVHARKPGQVFRTADVNLLQSPGRNALALVHQ